MIRFFFSFEKINYQAIAALLDKHFIIKQTQILMSLSNYIWGCSITCSSFGHFHFFRRIVFVTEIRRHKGGAVLFWFFIIFIFLFVISHTQQSQSCKLTLLKLKHKRDNQQALCNNKKN